MIALSIALICLTIITVSSLIFASNTKIRSRSSNAEKRKLLERSREIWLDSFRSRAAKGLESQNSWNRVEKIDQQLLALADEMVDEVDDEHEASK